VGTAFFTALAFGLGISLALGLGLATVLPRAALFLDSVLVIVLAIDYALMRFQHPRNHASSKYYRGFPDKSPHDRIHPFILHLFDHYGTGRMMSASLFPLRGLKSERR
jgi:hypothetical protein